MRSVLIKKSEGGEELFNPQKLINSLIKAGVNEAKIDKILLEVESRLHPNITSDQIYKIAFSKLKKEKNISSVKYSLRRSLLSLGPTGFPFEVYVSKLLENQGYETEVGQMLKGQCVDHEMDVVAWNKEELILIETKFHNELDLKTDLKVVLYVKSRFDDLKNQNFNFSNNSQKPSKIFIITNTKFTAQALQYAQCSGVNLIGWDFPKNTNLYRLIEDSGMYPLTSLNSLSKEDKITLIKNGLFDAKSLKEKSEILSNIGLSDLKIKKILDEVKEVCNIN
jgi:hypothetical protein